ncbi:MAG: type I-E CRISPR-associated protein Cas5/CasD [Thermoleophilia bacterium]
MGDLILLLRLEGPLQSWGTRSRWDVRDTGTEPSKSAVVGLLGCALGLRRHDRDLEWLDRNLHFAVRVDRPGVIATDFHTVTGYHRTAAQEFKVSGGTVKRLTKARELGESTIVSPRDYLHDASFLVALSSEQPLLLRQLAGDVAHPTWMGSLCHPRWPLYLGRKSCVPTRPVFLGLTDDYDGLEDAVRRACWERAGTAAGQPPRVDAWIEDCDGTFERQDALRLNRGRFFGVRRCRYISVPTPMSSGGS